MIRKMTITDVDYVNNNDYANIRSSYYLIMLLVILTFSVIGDT